jgi:multimeric flavodoxin WrbA
MHKLYDAIDQSDALILGSPVYMGQMSAQAKMFNDRLFGRYRPRFHPQFKEEEDSANKKLILLFTQGNPDSSRFQVYFDYTKNMFQWLGFDVRVHVVSGMRKGPAHERQELHSVMKDIGSSLALERSLELNKGL